MQTRSVILLLAAICLSAGFVDAGEPVISEFMAVNAYIPATDPSDIHTTVNGKQVHPDWIELHNTNNSETVSLDGWYLTDDHHNLTKWCFPNSVSIPGDGYLVVWASRKTAEDNPTNFPFVDDSGALHTSFKLSQNGGYLALVKPDGTNIARAINYPKQRGLVSYGLGSAGGTGYLKSPTPGASNSEIYAGVVDDTKFSINRGFFTNAIDVAISCQTPGATIRYTLDYSTPSATNGTIYTPGNPIHIDSTTCLRAAAFKNGWLQTDVDTQTYIYLDDVIRQSPDGEAPSGWPTNKVNSQVFDYGMDPDIVNSAEYGPQMMTGLKQIPSISLVTDFANLTDPARGIYVNAQNEGVMWERPTSVEFINPDGTKDFQANAGLRIRGAFSRGGNNPKHSFRLLFKGGYGPGKLRHNIFGKDAAKAFDNVDLRTAQNYSWSNTSSNPGERNTLLRDVFARDLQHAMGNPYTRSHYYHLYLNGQYWGIYQTQERSEASYAESYFGGHAEFYDVIKVDNYSTSFTDGSMDEWNHLWDLCEQGFASNSQYFAIQGKDPDGNDDTNLTVKVDIDNLIDYMLVIFYTGNKDGPTTLSGSDANNFYAIRDRRPQARQGWVFFAYDSEHSMLSTTEDRTRYFSAGSNKSDFNPQWLHQKLMTNQEYRLRFADHVQRAFFNNGVMTPSNATALLKKRIDEIDEAIIGESARWGDQRPAQADNPYTKATWSNEVYGFLVNTFLPGRTQTVLSQLKSRNLYPQVQPPVFSQHGGYVAKGFELTFTAPTGTIYYTTDGSDPRLIGGYTNSSASVFAVTSVNQTIIPKGAEWKYMDNGSDPGNNWMTAGYNDSGWSSGPAILGYGDADISTTVGYIDTDPAASGTQKNAATYFRTTFIVTNTAQITSLKLSLMRDDGAVVYINGQEVRRDNMADGQPAYTDFATGTVGGANETTYFDSQINPAVLTNGTNIIAVEIHQISDSSSDIRFDMELTAQRVTSPATIVINESTLIKTRAVANGVWSPLDEAVFSVGPLRENIRVTEIMYHSPDDSNNVDNAEYIEFKNVGPQPVSMNLCRLTKGVEFTFPSVVIDTNQYLVVVRDRNAFTNAHPGFNGIIAGQWKAGGQLANGGEKICFEDSAGTVIQEFSYSDSWYDITDGLGFSLTIKDAAATNLALWNEKRAWRPSATAGGSPGYDDAGEVPTLGSIVINEVLAHSHSTAPDWIELYNTTDTNINIGGWFISDDNRDLTNSMKYEIPLGTLVPAGGYIVFRQDSSFGNSNAPGCRIPFELSEGGDQVYLFSGSAGQITGYTAEESFGASASGIAFGRYYKESSASYNFVAMSTNTPGAANAYPKVGPLIITEIMYNPPPGTNDTYDNDEYEYVKVRNISTNNLMLQIHDDSNGIDVPWKFTAGIDYEFPLGTTIPPAGELIIAKKPVAYAERYGNTNNILGPYSGKLSNGGEKLEVSMPGDQEYGERYYIRIDRINYSDGSHPAGDDHWPTSADGNGYPLTRIHNNLYGNDFANWQGIPDNDGDGLPNSTDPDDDNDGIPDSWENAHALDPLAADAHANPDHDSADNWYEYVTDTDPHNPASIQNFSIQQDPQSRKPRLSFNTSSNRRYTIMIRDSLTKGNWTNLNGTFTGSGYETNIIDSIDHTNCFYRLRIQLP